ncbi:MAG: MFS transporter [Actinomycetia bacterium]|nr:MFS transporter [Actinomycetes bacterium]
MNAGPEWDPDEGHPRRKLILAVACLGLVLVVLSVSSLNIAIPTIIDDLQPTSSQLLWIIDSYALVFAGMLLLAGAIGDRYGRKGAFLSGLVVFGIGAILSSFATGPEMLILTRGVMGLGAAFVMPATLSIITSVFPPTERPKAIATWAGFAGAGGAIGPLLSGFVLQAWPGNWEAVFLINVPFVLATMVLVAALIPTSRDSRETRLDWLGAAISVVALGALLFGIIQGPESGWASAVVVGSFALCVVAVVAFLAWELHVPEPMLDPRFLRIPAFTAGSGVVTAVFFGMFGMFFLLTQYLQFVQGYSALKAGAAGLPAAATMILVAPRSADLAAHFGARRVVVGGAALGAVGFVAFANLQVDSDYWLVALALVLVASAVALCTAPASSAIVTSLPLDKAGVASAVNDTTREVGGALGIAVLGTIVTSVYVSEAESDIAAMPTPPPPFDEGFEQASEVALEGIGPALAVAERAPTPEMAETMVATASNAFVSGMSTAFWFAAGVMVLTAIVSAFAVPRRIEVSSGH